MQITNVRYSKTIQTAQYEPECLEAHAVLEDNDDFEKCAKELRERVSKVLGRKLAATKPESTPPKAENKPAATAKPTAKPKPTEEKPKTKAVAPKKKKPIAYNREVKAHQTELGKLLHVEYPEWKKDDDLRAKIWNANPPTDPINPGLGPIDPNPNDWAYDGIIFPAVYRMEIQDTTIASGQIGLLGDWTNGVNVVFDNFAVSPIS